MKKETSSHSETSANIYQ